MFHPLQNFKAYVKNEFQVQVLMIKTNNVTEYVNTIFGAFLSSSSNILPRYPYPKQCITEKEASCFGSSSLADVHNECAQFLVE
jgi:hypothetical protein